VQGRLNYLSNMTTLATINLTLKEIKDYKPPTAPTFWNRVISRFGESWDALVEFGQALALAVVGLVPWLPVLIPAWIAVGWGVRRYRRRGTAGPDRNAPVVNESRRGPQATDIPSTE